MKSLKAQTLVALIVTFISPVLFGQGQDEKMKKYDFLIEPQVNLGIGEYEISGDLDEGAIAIPTVGGKVGLKLGYIFIGLEYLEGNPSSSADRVVSDADRIRFPLMDSGYLTSFGGAIGYKWGRLMLWGAFYSETLDQRLLLNDVNFEHEYSGSGYRLGFAFRFYRNIYVGAYTHKRKFDEFTSNHPNDTAANFPLGRDVETTTYGITLSYLLPFATFIETKEL